MLISYDPQPFTLKPTTVQQVQLDRPTKCLEVLNYAGPDARCRYHPLTWTQVHSQAPNASSLHYLHLPNLHTQVASKWDHWVEPGRCEHTHGDVHWSTTLQLPTSSKWYQLQTHWLCNSATLDSGPTSVDSNCTSTKCNASYMVSNSHVSWNIYINWRLWLAHANSAQQEHSSCECSCTTIKLVLIQIVDNQLQLLANWLATTINFNYVWTLHKFEPSERVPSNVNQKS